MREQNVHPRLGQVLRHDVGVESVGLAGPEGDLATLDPPLAVVPCGNGVIAAGDRDLAEYVI